MYSIANAKVIYVSEISKSIGDYTMRTSYMRVIAMVSRLMRAGRSREQAIRDVANAYGIDPVSLIEYFEAHK